jgi:hypothetical protein
MKDLANRSNFTSDTLTHVKTEAVTALTGKLFNLINAFALAKVRAYSWGAIKVIEADVMMETDFGLYRRRRK